MHFINPSPAKRDYTAVQRQKAVSAYFTSKQILPFAFARAKGKRQYLLTLQVSRYCLLPLHGSIVVCNPLIAYKITVIGNEMFYHKICKCLVSN